MVSSGGQVRASTWGLRNAFENGLERTNEAAKNLRSLPDANSSVKIVEVGFKVNSQNHASRKRSTLV